MISNIKISQNRDFNLFDRSGLEKSVSIMFLKDMNFNTRILILAALIKLEMLGFPTMTNRRPQQNN